MAAGTLPSPTFGTVTANNAVVLPDGSKLTAAVLAAAGNLSDLASIAAALGNLGFTSYVSGSFWIFRIPTSTGRTFIVQGNAASISNDTSITFANAFPSACLGVWTDAQSTAGTVVYRVETDGIGTGGFAARPRSITNGGQVAVNTSALSFSYLAIGY